MRKKNHADVIVFEYLEMQGKISGKKKTETAPVEKKEISRSVVNIRHTGKGDSGIQDLRMEYQQTGL